MRQRARKDLNQEAIVDALKAHGASVYVSNNAALPDLVVGSRGRTFLLEVKSDSGKLTRAQETFFATWKGHAAIVRCPEDAIAAVFGRP